MSICMSFGNRYNIYLTYISGCDVYSKSLSTPLLICQSRLYCEKEVRGVERIKNEIYKRFRYAYIYICRLGIDIISGLHI